MYQNSFFGYFYSCNGFGHKEIDCRKHIWGGYMRKNNKYTHELSRKIYSSFSPFLNYNIICYNCNNYGHIAKFYKSDSRKIIKRKPQQSCKEIRNKGKKRNKYPCSFKLHIVHKIIKISGTLIVGAIVTWQEIEQSSLS